MIWSADPAKREKPIADEARKAAHPASDEPEIDAAAVLPVGVLALGFLLAAVCAGCSLGLDESLIPGEVPATDAALQDGAAQEADAAIEHVKDGPTDPVQETETGTSDVQKEAADAALENDSG